jgi:glycosyltransferase involved in cell wall biosynthesis
MNILYISHEGNLGGASRSLLGIIDELKDNINVFVMTNDKNGDFINELKQRKIKIINCKYYWWMSPKSNSILSGLVKCAICNLVNYFTSFRIAFMAKKLRIDIIHSNTSVVNIGALISKFSEIPHIWHIREFGEEDHGLYFRANKNKCIKFMNDSSSRIITISKAVYDKYKEYIDNDKLCVIYNGISSTYLQVKSFNKRKSSVDILISGSVNKGKGQKDAIKSMKEIINLGFSNVNLNIAGRGNQDYINMLKKLVKDLNLKDNVKFLGYISNMKKLRQDMDIELVCSKKEAFGRVTIEAMMSMMPVIGSNTGGTRELIKDGFNGLLYEQENYHDLADKIKYLLENREKIIEMGTNAYNFAKENFTAKKNAEEIYKIYKKVLNIN